jgi:membrane-anchored protein YejM (alkaline phosphatase superfamily)
MPETKDEQLDRELIELLNELRVALPGVQVLFAFLLVVPFQQGFARLSELDRDVYFVAVMAAMVATALLIAPSVFHRVRFRDTDKEWLIQISNRLALAGTFFIAVAMVCTVFLITDLLFGGWQATTATIASAVLFGGLWYGIALYREARG